MLLRIRPKVSPRVLSTTNPRLSAALPHAVSSPCPRRSITGPSQPPAATDWQKESLSIIVSDADWADRDAIIAGAAGLIDDSAGPRRWELTSDRKGVQRVVRFKGFGQCWDFMNVVAAEAKRQKHHPEWTNIYNKAFVRWTTHRPSGLSRKDIAMAQFTDRAASEAGEIDPSPKAVDARSKDGEESIRTNNLQADGDCCSRKHNEKHK